MLIKFKLLNNLILKFKLNDLLNLKFNLIPENTITSLETNSKSTNLDKLNIVKPYSCQLCERRFNSKYNVIRHLKQYHADRRMFKCDVCGRDYKWVDSLHKHMKLHKNINNS